jgi:two-component system chemotaxis sensor kinase CheA
MGSIDTNETIVIFQEESLSILKDFVQQLCNYEKNNNSEIIIKLMRDAHSIKGAAGIVGQTNIQTIAHKIEDLLSTLRNSDLQTETTKTTIENIKNLIIEITDFVQNINTDKTNEEKICEIIKLLPTLKTDINIAKSLENLTKSIIVNHTEINEILSLCNKIFYKISISKQINSNLLNTLSASFKTIKKIICDNSKNENLYFIKQRLSVAEQMIDISNITEKEQTIQNTKPKMTISDVLKNLGQGSIRVLRIESDKIDKLNENVNNLKLISDNSQINFSRLKEITEEISSRIFVFEKNLNEMKKIIKNIDKENIEELISNIEKENIDSAKSIEEIQKLISNLEGISDSEKNTEQKMNDCLFSLNQTIHSIKMLPTGVILHMFPRMVRDIAQSEKKEIDLEITGGETLVDNKILEEIKNPIIHLLRNAVDHGTELPEIREQQGKPRAGKISISTKIENNNLYIVVQDDGKGIDFNKIKEKAIEKGLYNEEEINTLSKSDLINLILKEGFTTQDKITEISGRGMGLDIVSEKMKILDGTIKIDTEEKIGTKIILEIPVEENKFGEKKKRQNKNNKKIIVIDDSKTTKIYLTKIFEKAGYIVSAYDNPIAGLKEVKNNGCDILISDIEMPEINGIELITEIRKEKRFEQLPIITISMLPLHQVQEMFGETYVDFMLNKSDLDEKELLKIVQSLLK